MVFRSQHKFSILCQRDCGMHKRCSKEQAGYMRLDSSTRQGSCCPAVRTWGVTMLSTSCWVQSSWPTTLHCATVCFCYPAGRALSYFKRPSWEEFPWLCLSEHLRVSLSRLQKSSISLWLASCVQTASTFITGRPASSDAPKILRSKYEAAHQG